MSSGLVKYEHGMPTWRYSQTDRFQMKRHCLGICIGQYKTNRRIALRENGVKDVSRL